MHSGFPMKIGHSLKSENESQCEQQLSEERVNLLRKSGVTLAVLATGSAISAQTTNCMNMGPNMVHCDSTNGASTNCMGMGPTMATCTTTGGNSNQASNSDGGEALG